MYCLYVKNCIMEPPYWNSRCPPHYWTHISPKFSVTLTHVSFYIPLGCLWYIMMPKEFRLVKHGAFASHSYFFAIVNWNMCILRQNASSKSLTQPLQSGGRGKSETEGTRLSHQTFATVLQSSLNSAKFLRMSFLRNSMMLLETKRHYKGTNPSGARLIGICTVTFFNSICIRTRRWQQRHRPS